MNLKGLHLSQKMKYSHGINQNQRSIISVPPRRCNGQRFRLAIKRLRVRNPAGTYACHVDDKCTL